MPDEYKKVSQRKIPVKYGGKEIVVMKYTGENYTRSDIRDFVSKKAQVIAEKYPDTRMAVLLHYESVLNPRSGGFFNVGDPVKMHDFSYDETVDFEENITGFQIQITI